MHDFTTASQAVDKIIKTALDKKAKKICSVELRVGELSMHGEEQLIFWIKEMLASRVDIAKDVKIEITPVKESRECVLNQIQLEV